ncbi:hypothetical protein PMAYCL1PPCAC_25053, partial [Pristionchus mayeri]
MDFRRLSIGPHPLPPISEDDPDFDPNYYYITVPSIRTRHPDCLTEDEQIQQFNTHLRPLLDKKDEAAKLTSAQPFSASSSLDLGVSLTAAETTGPTTDTETTGSTSEDSSSTSASNDLIQDSPPTTSSPLSSESATDSPPSSSTSSENAANISSSSSPPSTTKTEKFAGMVTFDGYEQKIPAHGSISLEQYPKAFRKRKFIAYFQKK